MGLQQVRYEALPFPNHESDPKSKTTVGTSNVETTSLPNIISTRISVDFIPNIIYEST